MSSKNAYVSVVVASVLVLAACPVEHLVAAGECDGGSCASYETLFDEALLATICDQRRACGIASTDTTCADVTWGRRATTMEWAVFSELLDAGLVDADLAAMRQCVDTMKTTCGTDCWPPFSGTSNLGEPCDHSLTCKPGFYCDQDTCSCARQLSSGQETPSPDACPSSIYSNLPDGGLRCQNLVPIGGNCDAPPDETILRSCVDGAGCSLGSDGIHSCVANAAAGEACLPNACEPGFVCRGVCVRRARLNEACDSSPNATQLPNCTEDLDCRNGHCAVPSGQAGSSCGPDARCAPPFSCRGAQCVRLSNTGEPCNTNMDCGVMRDRCQNGLCRREPKRGEACTRTEECGYGHVCNEGVCTQTRCAP